MSIDVMKRVWDHSQSRGTTRLVLLSLADRADEDGIAWPGIRNIAKRANIQDRQAQRALRALERAGELFTILNSSKYDTNHYFVTVGLTDAEIVKTLVARFDIAPEQAQNWRKTMGVIDDTGVTDDTPPVSQMTPPPVSQMTPDTSVKPSVEPSFAATSAASPQTSQTSNKNGNGKTSRQPSKKDVALSELENEFSRVSNIALPPRQTAKQKKAAAARWWNPLWQIYQVSNCDTERASALMRQAIIQMRKGGMTVSAPASIESVVTSIAASQKSSENVGNVYV